MDHRPSFFLLATVATFAALGCGSASDSKSSNGALATTTPATSTLAALSIAELPLIPAFSPSIHDYVVQCTGDTNTLSVAWTSAAGASVSITTPSAVATTSGSSQTATLTVATDQAIVLQTPDATTAAQYWIRCLPPDFPSIIATFHPAVGAPTPGWYLIGQAYTGVVGLGNFAMVLDGNGTPVWYRRTTNDALDVDLRGDNLISYIDETPPSGFGADDLAAFELHDLSAGTTSTVSAVGMPTDVHELQTLQNGDSILVATPLLTGVDLTGLEAYGADSTIVDCVLQEIGSSGELVWQWRASDHIDVVRESTYPQAAAVNGATVVDVFHCNSIQESTTGDLLISARHLDAIFLVSKASGVIQWKLGGAAYNKDGAQLLTVVSDTPFYRQHDARFLPDGTLSLFDDETAMPYPARAIIYSLDFTAGTATPTWQHPTTISSLAMGSVRRYTDGETLIGWGWPSSGTAVFSEIGPSGESVLDVSFARGDSYRAIKVPVASLDLDLMRETAGGS